MQYLDSITLPSRSEEDGFCLSYPKELEMACYNHENVYPFRLFPEKELKHLSFAPITCLYGGNGSGKSTLLNIIAEKLSLSRTSPFNRTPFFEPYLEFVSHKLTYGQIPKESRIITSDDVFDFLLDIRAIHQGIDRKREELFAEYDRLTDPSTAFQLRSLDDYEELKERNEARRLSKSQYTARRLPKETGGKSNGESAYIYFTRAIGENALYLLDEPENSLSVPLQKELAQFIEDSVRFYGCQFIISTHSPFLLSLKGARVYDLDARPAKERKWTALSNVRLWRDFFKEHEKEFTDEI